MTLLLAFMAAWLVVAAVLSLLLCRAINEADRSDARSAWARAAAPRPAGRTGRALRTSRGVLFEPDLDEIATWYDWPGRPAGGGPGAWPPGRAPRGDMN